MTLGLVTAAAISLGILTGLPGCNRGEGPVVGAGPPATLPGAQGRAAAGAPYEVLHPDPSSLEDAVRQQLLEGRQALETTLSAGKPPAARGEAFGDLGRLYHAYDLRDGALGCYRNAAALDSGDHRWHFLLGVLLRRNGELEEARRSFLAALELLPADRPTLVRLGGTERELGLLEEAERHLRLALEQEGGSTTGSLELSRVLIARGDNAGAVELLERILRLYPDATGTHYELGMAYRGMGDLDRAREHLALRGNVLVNPGDSLINEVNELRVGASVRKNDADDLYAAGLYDRAEEEYRRALEVDPDLAMAHMNLGATLAKLGRDEDALVETRTAVRLAPDLSVTHLSLGTLLARLGEESDALLHLREAVRLDPVSPQANMNCGNALRRHGEFEEALVCYRAVAAQEPSHEPARFAGILTLIRLGRFDEALAASEEAARALPDSDRIRGALARLLATNPDPAKRDGARAVAIASEIYGREVSLDSVETAAMALAESGNLERALEYQRAAIGAAESAGREDLLTFLRAVLARYEAGKPCREPYDPQGIVLSPSLREETRR